MNRLIPLLLLAALAFPAAAAAKSLAIEGPITVKGHGPLRAELSMANPKETRPVVLGGQAGAVRFVDLAGDLRVSCQGRGRARVGENEQGQKVVVCRGRAGRVKAHGSKFRVVAALRTWGLAIPQGVTGTLSGRFERADRRQSPADRPGAARDEQPLPPAPGEAGDEQGAPSDEEIEEAIDEISGGDE